jgi:hypothetical protein
LLEEEAWKEEEDEAVEEGQEPGGVEVEGSGGAALQFLRITPASIS